MSNSAKRVRKSLSLNDKLAILRKIDANPGEKKVDLAKYLNLPTSTLHSIVAKRKEIEENAVKWSPSHAKKVRVQPGRYKDLENCLMEWYQQHLIAGLPVSGPILHQKAKLLAVEMHMPDDFIASAGWFFKFRQRFGIKFKKVCSDPSGVVVQDTVLTWKEQTLPLLVENYELEDVFVAHETGLLYKLLPDQTQGDNMSKERITVLLCANASGTEKLPPLVIGKLANPRCLKGIRSLPTEYTHNTKALVSTKVFENWLRVFDVKMGAMNRTILLFVNQCSAHPTDTSYLRNIVVQFIPVDSTSELQPFDFGIIQSLKTKYRRQLLQRNICLVNQRHADVMKVNILQAMTIVANAWDAVSHTTIYNCMRKAGLHVDREQMAPVVNDMDDEEVDLDPQEWELLQCQGTFTEYVNADSDLVTCQLMNSDGVKVEHESDSSDDEDDDISVGLPAYSDAVQGLECLQQYLFSRYMDSEEQQLIARVSNLLYRHRGSVVLLGK